MCCTNTSFSNIKIDVKVRFNISPSINADKAQLKQIINYGICIKIKTKV